MIDEPAHRDRAGSNAPPEFLEFAAQSQHEGLMQQGRNLPFDWTISTEQPWMRGPLHLNRTRALDRRPWRDLWADAR